MAYDMTQTQARQRLERAIAAHERGDIDAALEAYRQILAIVPDHPVAQNLLGTGLLQLGRPAEAVPYLERATRFQRDNPNLLANLAQAYLAVRRYPEACEAFRKASRLAPKEAHFQVGVAAALALQGKLLDAEALLRRQAQRFPTAPLVWLNLGNVLRDLQCPEAAIDAYRKAAELEPRDPEARNNLGRVLHATGRFTDAEAEYRACLDIDTEHMAARFNLASLTMDVGRLAEAESIWRDIIALEPQNPEPHAFLAAALGHQGRLLEALSSHAAAARCAPGNTKHLAHYGAALMEVGRAAESRRALIHALGRSPDDETPAQLLGNALLAHGALQDGWTDYGLRPAAIRFRDKHSKLGLSYTVPADVNGRRICVLREQGLGDEIFFLRYARVLAARGARVSYCAATKITSLLARVPHFAQVVDESAPLPDADIYILLGDLPHALGAAPSSRLPFSESPREPLMREFAEATRIYWPAVPESIALEPLAESLARMRQKLATVGPPPYIGLTWRAGTPPEQQDSVSWMLYKHIALPDLATAISASGGTVIALQRKPAPGEIETLAQALGRAVHDFTAYNEDLESMLALLALLDEYVGVSNTNMHLRAAVGRNARVLVPAPAEWRWMHSGRSSPWFPGFKIYRQGLDGDWSRALARLARDLET